MRKEERKTYTDAVTCLQNTNAKTPASIAPGAIGRNYDFTVTHILVSLRNECNYSGPIPYWDWPKYANATQDSLLFNGDEYSMGSNGAWDPDFPIIVFPPGSGSDDIQRGIRGGCVTNGPFRDMVITLGPITLPNPGSFGGLGYNPTCLKRDINPAFARRWSNWTSVLETFQWQDIGTFQDFLQGVGTRAGGVHGGGHFTISGDPGGDLYVSTGDPAFYLHHAQMDRLWTIWQGLDPKNRQYKINGTTTMNNDPPSNVTQLGDFIDVGFAGGKNVTIHDILSTVRGPFCYVYV
ncbi:hypothetical protein HYALB_00001247 [Hymenoscyphus albidus]|uniref:Tyrosinase copper-binding domain-containing protein n=1 Tax=Hymenoscyphus albidus TaxID=595503 RepID=A0A9N9LFJ9_9HELO|nr:hypothetical protein HYALB_00001247 [Hymenoscyphus albidus]